MTPEQRRHWVRVVLSHTQLTAAQKTVLIALETYADYRDGTDAYPGEANLAALCGLKPRAVRYALEQGRALGLIERTSPANHRAGQADVYRLIPSTGIVGLKTPVDEQITGTLMPVEHPITGTAVPVNNSITGTAVHDHRHGHNSFTGTAVPPTFPSPSNHHPPSVLRKSGTSPARDRDHPEVHTSQPPSRFCDEHPRGCRGKCGNCANARTAFKAWQSGEAEHDLALAANDDFERRRRYKAKALAIENCPNRCDPFGRLDERSGVPEGHPLWMTPCDHQPMLRVVDG